MKNTRRLLQTLVTALSVCLFGCIREDGERSAAARRAAEEVGEAVDAVQTLASEKVKELRETMKPKLAAMDRRIDELRREAEQTAAAGTERIQMYLQKLAEKREALDTKLRDLGSAAGASWERVKSGLDAAYEDLEEAVKAAAAELGREN